MSVMKRFAGVWIVSEIGPVERYESPVMMCDAVNDVLLSVPANVCVVNESSSDFRSDFVKSTDVELEHKIVTAFHYMAELEVSDVDRDRPVKAKVKKKQKKRKKSPPGLPDVDKGVQVSEKVHEFLRDRCDPESENSSD